MKTKVMQRPRKNSSEIEVLSRNVGVRGRRDRIFDGMIYVILFLVAFSILFPMLFVISASLTPYTEVMRNGGFLVIPRVISFDAYETLFQKSTLSGSFQVSTFITVVGTVLNVFFTALMAFPLSRKKLPGRKFFINMVVLTLMFNGGMIPTYLVVQKAGLVNTLWSMIIPQVIWTQYLIILKNFMENIPSELLDSARIDGAGEFRSFLQIVLPLCKPILVTIAIDYGVQHWNEFQQAILYITKPDKWPLQVVVRNILTANQQVVDADQVVPTMTLQMASVVTASLPIVALYPFLQRFYVSGITTGAVKG